MRKWLFLLPGLLIVAVIAVFLLPMKEFLQIRFGGVIQQNFFNENNGFDKATYLMEHSVELADVKVGDTYFLVNSKQINHTEGIVWVHAYSLSPDEKQTFFIRKVSMITNDGVIVYEDNTCNLVVSETTPEKLSSGDNHLLTFTMSDDWYFKGNHLTLSIEIEINGQVETISYNVEVYAIKRHFYL